MGFWRNSRRRAIRLLGWGIGLFASLIAVLALVFTAYILFFDYPEQLKAILERELTRATGRTAQIARISVNLPNSFELIGVRIDGPEQEEPVLELGRMRGSVRLGELVRLRLHWSELRFDGLVVRIGSGSSKPAPRPKTANDRPASPSAPSGSSASPLSFSADSVVLQDALLQYHHRRIPLTLSAESLDARLVRESATSYRGSLSYENGRLQVKEHPEIRASVESEFGLVGRQLRVDRFDATSEIGELHASGVVSLSEQPIGRLNVTGAAEVQQILHALFGLTVLDSPSEDPLELDGALVLEEAGRRLEGELRLLRGRFARLPLESWRSDVSWSRNRFRLSNGRGLLAGGRAKLSLDQPLPARDHLADIELSFEDSELTRAIAAWNSNGSRLSSLLTGTVSLKLRPSAARETVQGQFAIRGAAPSSGFELGTQPGPGSSLPAGPEPSNDNSMTIRLVSEGSLDSMALTFERLELGSSGTELSVRGRYPFESGAELALRLTSHDLSETDELQRELRALVQQPESGRNAELWGIEGRGSTTGVLTGSLSEPAFAGGFQGEGVRFQGVDWGEIEGRGRLQRGVLAFEEFRVRKADSSIRGSGDVAVGRVPASERDFAINAIVEQWPSEDVSKIFELGQWPLNVLLSGSIVAARGQGELSGDASFTSRGGTLFGHAIDGVSASARLENRDLIVGPVSISHEGGELAGRLRLGLGTGTLNGTLTVRSFELGSIPVGPTVPDRPEDPNGDDSMDSLWSGRVDADLVLGGSLKEPEMQFDGVSANLAVGNLPLGDAEWHAVLAEGALTARLDARAKGDQRFIATLSGVLAETAPLQGNLRFDSVDFAPLLRSRQSESAEFAPSFKAVLSGEGPFEIDSVAPYRLSAEFSLNDATLAGESYRFSSTKPVGLRVSNGIVELDPVLFAQDESQMTLGGSLDVAAETMDIQIGGATSFSVVETFYPSMVTAGAIDLSARMTGAWSRPSLTGFAELKGGSIRVREFPQPLSNLTGRIIFDNRTARLENIQGVFGSAPIVLSGDLSMSGLTPESFDLQARGDGLRLRYPEGFLATLDAELSLVGSADAQVLGGDIEIRDAVWTREYDVVSNIMSQRNQLDRLEDLADDHPLKDIRFDIRIRAPGNLRVRNSLASIDASAELELGGNFRQPVLLGRSEAERGQIFFLGQRYDVTNGKIDFVDPTGVEPFFDLTAETRVRSYRIELRLAGTADRIEPELSSDPPLRTIDILRLLAGATERDILVGTEEEELAGVGVASILTERLSQEVGRRAERLFGLDRFSIDPFLVGQFANPTARVSLGKQISRDVSIRYSVNLNTATESIVLIEYTPDGPVSWLVSRDETGELGIDMRFRKSF